MADIAHLFLPHPAVLPVLCSIVPRGGLRQAAHLVTPSKRLSRTADLSCSDRRGSSAEQHAPDWQQPASTSKRPHTPLQLCFMYQMSSGT